MKATKEKHHDVKRFINISDTHFGIRSNSNEWVDIHRSYFFDWFIPLLKKNYQPGDALMHNGDVFDSRQSINLNVMNMGLEIFEAISKIMPVYVICGNHDIYRKNTNAINSLKMFKWLDNVHVYEEPIILEVNGGKTDILLMPWRATKEQEQETVYSNTADYLFCHTDMQGLKFNRNVKVDEGINIETLKKFKRVYSGHIHYAQNAGNVRMIGSPYQLTRSDIGNAKSVWFIDFTNDTEDNIVNDFTPKFIKVNLDKLLELRFKRAEEILENNFVDILVDAITTVNFPFSSFLDLFSNIKYRKLNYIITSTEDNDDWLVEELEGGDETIDLPSLVNLYIDSLSYNEGIKTRLKEVSKTLYIDTLKNSNEETVG
jgi:DNA repair exonuclease SbcCD nuclease subunit